MSDAKKVPEYGAPYKYNAPAFTSPEGNAVGKAAFGEDFGNPNGITSPEQSRGPNILYLTTDCNLACDYCYELEERNSLEKQRVMTKAELSKALEVVYGKWSGDPSKPETIVIFGGEPFLEPDSVKYIFERSLELSKEAFAFCLTTNGIWFLKEDNIKLFLEWTKNRTVNLEVSWDGSGNFRRVYKNQKSAEDHIDKALDNLSKYNVPVTLRYTVHAGNYDKVIQDYIYGIERWSNVHKIQNSYDYTGLDKIKEGKNWEELIYGDFRYRDYFRALWNKYKKPLCQEVCDLCNYCDKTLTAINYFIAEEDVMVKPSNDIGQAQNKPFNHWVKGNKEK